MYKYIVNITDQLYNVLKYVCFSFVVKLHNAFEEHDSVNVRLFSHLDKSITK